jgi:hypothetical protein
MFSDQADIFLNKDLWLEVPSTGTVACTPYLNVAGTLTCSIDA